MSFADLLRRSRFATFDPCIRQAYGAPPSHISRGNWGLKRPLPIKRKNAYITLNNFEEHAQYIEWDNAEPQVRFLRRVDELNVASSLSPTSEWYTGLGAAAVTKDSQMDSDFCPGEKGMGVAPPKRSITEADELAAAGSPAFSPDLDALGTRGKRGYGVHASPAATLDLPAALQPKPTRTTSEGTSDLQPNIFAMSPKAFNRYLEKLRALRPEFDAYVRAQEAEAPAYLPSIDADLDSGMDKSAQTGITPMNVKTLMKTTLHAAFLAEWTKKEFEDEANADAEADATPKPKNKKSLLPTATIRQQPHRFAGLTYHTPTPIESVHIKPLSAHSSPSSPSTSSTSRSTTSTQTPTPPTFSTPALLLQDKMEVQLYSKRPPRREGVIASFGGITAEMRKDHLSNFDAQEALLDPQDKQGVVLASPLQASGSESVVEGATKEVRAFQLELLEVPKVVGERCDERPLETTKMQAKVVERKVFERGVVSITGHGLGRAGVPFFPPPPSSSSFGSSSGSSLDPPAAPSYASYLAGTAVRNAAAGGASAASRVAAATSSLGMQEPTLHPIGSMAYNAHVPSWYKRQANKGGLGSGGVFSLGGGNGGSDFAKGYVGYQNKLGASSSSVAGVTSSVMDTLRGLPGGGGRVGASRGQGNVLTFGSVNGVRSKADEALSVLSRMSATSAAGNKGQETNVQSEVEEVKEEGKEEGEGVEKKQ